MTPFINTSLFGRIKDYCNVGIGVSFIAIVFFALNPLSAKAMVYFEDFDDLTVGSDFPSPWTEQTDRYDVTADEYSSAPNSIQTNAGGVYSVQYDFGTSTRGLISMQVNPINIPNFHQLSIGINDGYDTDDHVVMMMPQGLPVGKSFFCGRRDSGYEEFDDNDNWQEDQWSALFFEYQVVPVIGGDFVTYRCGFQLIGLGGTVWSQWMDTNPLHLGAVSGVSILTVTTDNTNIWYMDNVSITTDADYDELELYGTRVTAVSPVTRNGSLTATSTEMVTSVTGFINEEDFVEGTTIKLTAFRLSSQQQTSALMAWENATDNSTSTDMYSFSYPVLTAGEFNFSSEVDTSQFLQGEYSIVGEIIFPVEAQNFIQSTWQYLMSVLENANGTQPATSPVRRVDRFIIGGLTWYDQYVTDTVAARDRALLDAQSCNPLSSEFDILECLALLILPTESQLASLWDQLYTQLFSKVPFGYITRFVEIVSSAEAQIPPAIVYTFGSSSPASLQGLSVDFQIFDPANWSLITEIESDSLTNPKNLWDIIMPYVNTIIALGVLGVILADLMRMGVPSFGRSYSGRGRGADTMDNSDIEKMKINDYSDISEAEWQNLKSNRLI